MTKIMNCYKCFISVILIKIKIIDEFIVDLIIFFSTQVKDIFKEKSLFVI